MAKEKETIYFVYARNMAFHRLPRRAHPRPNEKKIPPYLLLAVLYARAGLPRRSTVTPNTFYLSLRDPSFTGQRSVHREMITWISGQDEAKSRKLSVKLRCTEEGQDRRGTFSGLLT
jgi:hypothetical protein